MRRAVGLGVVLGVALAFAAVVGCGGSKRHEAAGMIAFNIHHGDNTAPWDIYVVRADGHWVSTATVPLDEYGPAWSPDGDRIAFEQSPSERNTATTGSPR